MITVKGKVTFITEKSYKDKEGKTIKNYDLDIKQDDERWAQTVNVPDKVGNNISKGDEVEIPVRIYTYNTKSGSIFTSLKLDTHNYDVEENK